MHRLRVASVVLLGAGVLACAGSAVRIGLYWVIDPSNEVLVLATGLLLAAGLVAGALSLQVLRGRAFRTAAALVATGAVLLGAARVVVEIPGPDGSGIVAYGPGTPPSISWSLLAGQVDGPVLATCAVALLVAALGAGIAGTARAAAGLRSA